MELDLFKEGKEYISASRAAKKIGYASDYIGQLCRMGKVPGKLIGRSWYVDFESLVNHKRNSKLGKPKLDTTPLLNTHKFFRNIKIVYESDVGPRLPEIRKIIKLKEPISALFLVRESAIVTLSLIFAIGAGFSMLEITSPSLSEGIRSNFPPNLNAQLAAVSVFDKFSSAVERLRDMFGKRLANTNPTLPSPYQGRNTGEGHSIAVTNTSDLKRELEDYIRSQITNNQQHTTNKPTAPTNIYNEYHYNPTINQVALREEILKSDTHPVVTRQSDSDADRRSVSISRLTDGGTFTNSTLTSASVSGTGNFSSLSFTNATGTDLKANTADIGNLTITSCTGCGGSTFSYPFAKLSTGENATSTTILFSGDNSFIATASSTLASTTASSLLVTGSATSTNLYTNNLLTFGSSTIQSLFSNSATGTNLYATNFLANGSSTLQNFTGINSTTTNSTSTAFAISGLSSQIPYAFPGGSIGALTLGQGLSLSLGSLATTFQFPWTKLSTNEMATSTTILFSGANSFIATASSTLASTTASSLLVTGSATSTNLYTNNLLTFGSSTIQSLFSNSATGTNLYATNFLANGSSTLQNFTGINSTTTNSTSTAFAISGLSSQIPYAFSGGSIGALTLGQGLSLSLGSLATTFQFPWTKLSTNEMATSTTILFSGANSFIATASSTLASTTASSLLVTGSATSTNLYTNNLLTFGSSTIQSLFSNSATGTNLYATNFLANGSSTLQNFTGINSTTTNSTSTAFAISGLSSQIPYAFSGGSIGALTLGQGLSLSLGSLATTFQFPWTKLSTNEMATSTTILFSGANSFIATASSTLASTTASSLLVTGSATSTNLYTNNLLTFGSSTIQSLFSNSATGTNLYATNFLANGSSTLQNFTGINSTTTNSTSTAFAISGLSSQIPY